MKRLHGIRVFAWAQKRYRRNRQRFWDKFHREEWNVFDFILGRGISSIPFKNREYSNRPQRSLDRA